MIPTVETQITIRKHSVRTVVGSAENVVIAARQVISNGTTATNQTVATQEWWLMETRME